MTAFNAADGSPPGNRSVGGKQFVPDLEDTATLELITFASKLSKELYPDYPDHHRQRHHHQQQQPVHGRASLP